MNQVEIKRHQIEMGSYVIGLLNILIFGNLLGNNGISFLLIALECYAVIWTITAGSLTDALGRMLKNRNAKGQYRNTVRIRRRMLIIQGTIGIVSSILFAVCGGFIAQNIFKLRYSTLIIMILAPALFLRTISSVLLGYFQGEGTELPGAVVALLRQVGIMGFGLLFIKGMSVYGQKVSNLLQDDAYTAMYGGAGVGIAISLTELLILLFLCLIILGNRKNLLHREEEGMKQTDSLLGTVRILYASMWMSVLFQMLILLPVWVGALFYRKSVEDSDSFAQLYGLFGGKYVVICAIPITFICVLLISVKAKTVIAFRREDYRGAKSIFQCGMHVGVVNSLFFSVFVSVMANQLASMVCKAKAEVVAEMLRYGSTIILFTIAYFYFSGLLMRMGKKYHILLCLGFSDILFIIVLSILLNGEKSGVMSLVYASVISLGAGSIVLGFLCCRRLHTGIEWLRILVIPAGAVAVTGLVCMFLSNVMTAHLGNWVTVFVCLILSMLIYWAILLLLRSFREQDLKYIPGGRIIYAAGQTLKVF